MCFRLYLYLSYEDERCRSPLAIIGQFVSLFSNVFSILKKIKKLMEIFVISTNASLIKGIYMIVGASAALMQCLLAIDNWQE